MSILTETQCRTARALLNWSQADLAKKSNLSESTIRDFEKRRRIPSANNLHAIVSAFRHAGVVLLDDGQTTGIGGEGARFAEDSSGKKLENEIQQLEEELKSARSVKDFLSDQFTNSPEMKNNIGFKRLLLQSEREVDIIETRISMLQSTLRRDIARATYFSERAQKLMDEPVDDPKDL